MDLPNVVCVVELSSVVIFEVVNSADVTSATVVDPVVVGIAVVDPSNPSNTMTQ